MTGLIRHRDVRDQFVFVARDRRHGHIGRGIPGLLDKRVDRIRQIGVYRQHVIVLPNAEDLVIREVLLPDFEVLHELRKHFEQRHIQSLELMAREPGVAEADLHLVRGKAMLHGWVGIVLHGRDRLLNSRHFQSPGRVAIGIAHVAILARLRFRAFAELVLVTAIEPLEVGHLFQVVAHWFFVHDRAD